MKKTRAEIIEKLKPININVASPYLRIMLNLKGTIKVMAIPILFALDPDCFCINTQVCTLYSTWSWSSSMIVSSVKPSSENDKYDYNSSMPFFLNVLQERYF